MPVSEDVRAAHWGIEPVPEQHRRLSSLDIGVLWGNLGVGLLVIVTGALLPAIFGMSIAASIISILLGSLIGCALLGLGGLAGAREGTTTMALMRPLLGERGSWIPSSLNAAQLLGWTAFELWAMALVADLMTKQLWGASFFKAWVVLFAVLVLAFSLWGPLGVIRAWMERFAIWALVVIAALITVFLIASHGGDISWTRGKGGSLIFGVPLDLVIAMPVSWLPLVADYNRFASSRRGSFSGTFIGYFIANVWFYALGVFLIATTKATPDPQGIALGIFAISGIALTGPLMLTGLMVGETDQAFANVYSGALSLKNVFTKLDNRKLVLGVTVVGALLAGGLTMIEYEFFLLLLGSVFTPLFGVWFADYFVLGNRVVRSGIRIRPLIAWVLGFLVYHWIVPTSVGWWTDLTNAVWGPALSETRPWLGGSIPALVVAFAVHLTLQRFGPKRKEGA